MRSCITVVPNKLLYLVDQSQLSDTMELIYPCNKFSQGEKLCMAAFWPCHSSKFERGKFADSLLGSLVFEPTEGIWN